MRPRHDDLRAALRGYRSPPQRRVSERPRPHAVGREPGAGAAASREPRGRRRGRHRARRAGDGARAPDRRRRRRSHRRRHRRGLGADSPHRGAPDHPLAGPLGAGAAGRALVRPALGCGRERAGGAGRQRTGRRVRPAAGRRRAALAPGHGRLRGARGRGDGQGPGCPLDLPVPPALLRRRRGRDRLRRDGSRRLRVHREHPLLRACGGGPGARVRAARRRLALRARDLHGVRGYRAGDRLPTA